MTDTPETPPFDPYDILGVARDATEEDIRSAFRKLSKDCHPDSPSVVHLGDDAKAAAIARFKQLVRAKTLLTDPEARAAYDAGSDVDTQRVRAKARAMISQFVSEIIANASFKASHNILGAVKHKINDKIREAEKASKYSIAPNIPRLEALAKSITKRSVARDGDNVFVDIIESHIKRLKDGLRNNDEIVALSKLSLRMLDEYEFHEPPPDNRSASGQPLLQSHTVRALPGGGGGGGYTVLQLRGDE